MYPGHPNYAHMDDHIVHLAIKVKVETWPHERRRSLCGNNDMKILDLNGRLEVWQGMAQRSFSSNDVNCIGCLSELFLLSNEVKT